MPKFTDLTHRWMDQYAVLIRRNADMLTNLDRQIGDADHGANMQRGMERVCKIDFDAEPDMSAILRKTGMTLVSSVGGASGPLYGTFFIRMSAALKGVKPREDGSVDPRQFGQALRAGAEGIRDRGKAELGDKTMLDVWYPALDAFDRAAEAGEDLAGALAAAAKTADEAAEKTVPMVARKGRASYLGDRSAGVKDPGAASSALLLRSAAEVFAEE